MFNKAVGIFLLHAIPVMHWIKLAMFIRMLEHIIKQKVVSGLLYIQTSKSSIRSYVYACNMMRKREIRIAK